MKEMESTQTGPEPVELTGIKTIDKIADIPVVNTALSNVTDYYGHIKDSNILLRTSCNLAELSFKTIRFASIPITSLCYKPIESVDTYLCDKVNTIENTYPSIKQPTDKITSAAYSQVKGIYDKTNTMVTHPKETLYNLKDLTVSTATSCGSKVIETCLENRYTKMVTDPVLEYTEKSLNTYILPEALELNQSQRGTISRIYNINKHVYDHVYETTFFQLSKLHAKFDQVIQKLQSLKTLMFDIYEHRKTQLVDAVTKNTLVVKCRSVMESNNLSLTRLEELSRSYYKAILADVTDIIDRYMGLVKKFPAYLNGTYLRTQVDYLKNQLDKESFKIYLSMSIEYLRKINQSLVSYTNKMIDVASQSSNICLQSLSFKRGEEAANYTD